MHTCGRTRAVAQGAVLRDRRRPVARRRRRPPAGLPWRRLGARRSGRDRSRRRRLLPPGLVRSPGSRSERTDSNHREAAPVVRQQPGLDLSCGKSPDQLASAGGPSPTSASSVRIAGVQGDSAGRPPDGSLNAAARRLPGGDAGCCFSPSATRASDDGVVLRLPQAHVPGGRGVGNSLQRPAGSRGRAGSVAPAR